MQRYPQHIVGLTSVQGRREAGKKNGGATQPTTALHFDQNLGPIPELAPAAHHLGHGCGPSAGGGSLSDYSASVVS